MSTASDAIKYMRDMAVLANTDAGSRIYVSVAPQSVSYPLVVMKVISMAPSPTQDSGSAVDTFRIQVDSYAKQSRTISDDSAFDTAHGLADTLRSTWSRNGSTFGDYDHLIDSIQEEDHREDFNTELETYRVSYDYMVRVNTTANAMTLLASGTYTPTLSNQNDITTLTITEAQYMRVGSTVTVSGSFTARVAFTESAGTFEMTLPIASNIGNQEDLAGVCSGAQNTPTSGRILGVPSTNTAYVSFIGDNGVDVIYSYTFTYQVI